MTLHVQDQGIKFARPDLAGAHGYVLGQAGMSLDTDPTSRLPSYDASGGSLSHGSRRFMRLRAPTNGIQIKCVLSTGRQLTPPFRSSS